MIEILCFGDSNTYGFTPDWKHRYGRDIRYPGVLQTLLGDGYYVAEDGLVGRTAAFPDSNRDGRSALETLPLSIESHGPVQYIVLMLGTNDCKIDKTRSAEDVGAGMDKLVRLVIGMLPAWTKILLVAPPPLGPAAPQRDPEYDAQSLAVSQGVAAQYQMIAEAYGLRFLDAGTVTQMSALDGEHLDPDGHKKLAAAIADIVRRDCEAGARGRTDNAKETLGAAPESPRRFFRGNAKTFLTFVSFSDMIHLACGGIAQLGERLNGIQEVSGSIPLISTTKIL